MPFSIDSEIAGSGGGVGVGPGVGVLVGAGSAGDGVAIRGGLTRSVGARPGFSDGSAPAVEDGEGIDTDTPPDAWVRMRSSPVPGVWLTAPGRALQPDAITAEPRIAAAHRARIWPQSSARGEVMVVPLVRVETTRPSGCDGGPGCARRVGRRPSGLAVRRLTRRPYHSHRDARWTRSPHSTRGCPRTSRWRYPLRRSPRASMNRGPGRPPVPMAGPPSNRGRPVRSGPLHRGSVQSGSDPDVTASGPSSGSREGRQPSRRTGRTWGPAAETVAGPSRARRPAILPGASDAGIVRNGSPVREQPVVIGNAP